MSTPDKSTNFPYKTLLWVIFAMVVVFLFRQPLIHLLEEAEEVTIWDKVKIKVSKSDVRKLEEAQAEYEAQIAQLNKLLSHQNNTINGLTVIKEKLEQDIANCPEAEETAEAFNLEFVKIKETNQDIRSQSDKLQKTNLLKVEKFKPK